MVYPPAIPLGGSRLLLLWLRYRRVGVSAWACQRGRVRRNVCWVVIVGQPSWDGCLILQYLPPSLFQLPNEWMAKTFATTTFFNGVRASKITIFYRIKFTHLKFE